MMQTVMRLRVPQDDLTALDQICGRGNRSEYLRGVFNSYLEDKKKVLAVFESTLGGFYDQKNCSNVTNGT